jgi:hypothetical protein
MGKVTRQDFITAAGYLSELQPKPEELEWMMENIQWLIATLNNKRALRNSKPTQTLHTRYMQPVKYHKQKRDYENRIYELAHKLGIIYTGIFSRYARVSTPQGNQFHISGYRELTGELPTPDSNFKYIYMPPNWLNRTEDVSNGIRKIEYQTSFYVEMEETE